MTTHEAPQPIMISPLEKLREYLAGTHGKIAMRVIDARGNDLLLARKLDAE
jgi:hypothetical protein